MLYYPCIYNNRNGRIDIKVSQKPMTKEKAENVLKRKKYLKLWLSGEAIPQHVNHPYFKAV